MKQCPEQSDALAEWAASFVRLQALEEQRLTQEGREGIHQAENPASAMLTPAAFLLLDAVDHGGVPAFMTSNLKQIASDNGIAVIDGMTPNEVINALRIRLQSP